jgi:hypothetical protein
VAVHARFGWRDSGKRQFLNCCVTVAAIDSLIADMMLVAELYGLFSWEKRLSVVRGSVELEQHPDADSNKENRAEDGSLRDEVGTSIEDLPHRSPTVNGRWKQRAQKAIRGSRARTRMLICSCLNCGE